MVYKGYLKEAGTSYDEIRNLGAIVLMQAKFNCDFNSGTDGCKPDWEFTRIDLQKGYDFSSGFNFYESRLTSEDSRATRTVTKKYGLKLEISVSGTGGKFSFVLLGVALGSGLGLLGVASLVTDFSLQHIFKSQEYLERKFDDLMNNDGEVAIHRSVYHDAAMASAADQQNTGIQQNNGIY